MHDQYCPGCGKAFPMDYLATLRYVYPTGEMWSEKCSHCGTESHWTLAVDYTTPKIPRRKWKDSLSAFYRMMAGGR